MKTSRNNERTFMMFIFTILMVLQIIFFVIFFNHGKVLLLKYIGLFLWILSAIFGWIPIFIFRKKGNVPKGKSYVNTTKLVDSSIYNLVRHPQFLAGILLSLAFVFISQHWLVIVLSIPIILILYEDSFNADKKNTEKFGRSYEKYMEKVPRMNFISGFIRKLS